MAIDARPNIQKRSKDIKSASRMPLLGHNGLGDTSYWCFVATIEKNDRKLGFS